MKRVTFRTDRELDGLVWCAKIMDFGTSLMIKAACNEVACAFVLLRDSRMFRQKVKQMANKAVREADRKVTELLGVMHNRVFYDDYSESVIEAAGHDISMFRLSLKSVMDRAGIADSLLYAHVETARALLNMCVIQFRDTVDLAWKRYGRDYSPNFREFDVSHLFEAWSSLCDLLYRNEAADLNTKETIALWNILCRKFGNGEYVKECMRVACDNHPEYDYNEIIVTER